MYRVRKQIGCSDQLVEACGREGITVGVLDTGIGMHPDFDARIIAFKDFINQKKHIYDDSGHGTHVSGCICGSGSLSGGIYKGIAPATRLVVGKVLNESGGGSIDDMYQGIEWMLHNRKKYKIRILNISIGMGEQVESSRMEKLLELVDEACKVGLIVVCAAGNMGPKPMTVSPLGSRREVITVGCHEGGYFGDREHLCEKYSGRGPSSYVVKKPDIVAPGTDIISCNVAFRRKGTRYKDAYISKSGTSMATPLVTGSLALLLQKHPDMECTTAKKILLHTATDLNEPWMKQGWGMVNVQNLLSANHY